MAGQASTPSTAISLRPGVVICKKYRLESPIAEGGMGVVWKGVDLITKTPVAIKVVRKEPLKERDLQPRLLVEAWTAARISHPNIIRILDCGYIDESLEPFLVMELLNGEDLASRISQQKRLSAIESVQLLLPIIDALADAHANGVVVRDIKPSNIFISVDAEGTLCPKIVDFGTAMTTIGDECKRITLNGAIVGSPTYLAPEQIRGEKVDRRADVWSLCATLYECVTGRPPFHDVSYMVLMARILEDPPVPITALAAGDTALWEIVARGLEKQPADRWDSMEDLRDALAKWLSRQRQRENNTRSPDSTIPPGMRTTVPPEGESALPSVEETRSKESVTDPGSSSQSPSALTKAIAAILSFAVVVITVSAALSWCR